MTNHTGLRRLRTVVLAVVATALSSSQTQVAPPLNEHSSAERAPSSGETAATNSHADSEPPDLSDASKLPASGPDLLDGLVSTVMVHVLGSACTGTPITDTSYVVTAAHCVLTPKGNVIQRSVVREGVEYRSVAVLVDTDYAKHPREQADAAVIVLAQTIPGPSARVGAAIPTSGQVTVAGYQPVDSDGGLLRGTDIDDHQRPTSATRAIDDPRYEPAGCVTSVRDLEVTTSRVVVPCGLVPGASGGGLYAQQDGGFHLVGIVSTVTADLSANGIVPIASLRGLFEHADQYTHEF